MKPFIVVLPKSGRMMKRHGCRCFTVWQEKKGVRPTFAKTKVGRTEGYQLQFEKPILRLHCAEPMAFK